MKKQIRISTPFFNFIYLLLTDMHYINIDTYEMHFTKETKLINKWIVRLLNRICVQYIFLFYLKSVHTGFFLKQEKKGEFTQINAFCE